MVALRSAAWLVVLVACVPEGEPAPAPPPIAADSRHAAGLLHGVPLAAQDGLPARSDEAVGRLETTDGVRRCTAFRIAPRLIASAAHCFLLAPAGDDFLRAQDLASLWFRSEAGVVPVVEVHRHEVLDLAVAVLGEAWPALSPSAPETPYSWPLWSGAVESLVGAEVLALGAGGGTPTEDGVHVAPFVVDALGEDRLTLRPLGAAGLCPGDSGAPILIRQEDERYAVIGVHYWGFSQCAPPSHSVRIDIAATWLEQRLAASVPPVAPRCEPAATREEEGNSAWSACAGDARVECAHGYQRTLDCSLAALRCQVAEGAWPARCGAEPCGDVPIGGVCVAGSARACVGGSLVEEDCDARGEGCAYDAALGRRTCVACDACAGACVHFGEDPAHCGGCFQACADGEACLAGVCLASADGGPWVEGGPRADAGALVPPDGGSAAVSPGGEVPAGAISGGADSGCAQTANASGPGTLWPVLALGIGLRLRRLRRVRWLHALAAGWVVFALLGSLSHSVAASVLGTAAFWRPPFFAEGHRMFVDTPRRVRMVATVTPEGERIPLARVAPMGSWGYEDARMAFSLLLDRDAAARRCQAAARALGRPLPLLVEEYEVGPSRAPPRNPALWICESWGLRAPRPGEVPVRVPGPP